MTQIWAHRGASAYAPENTMEAFRLAAEMGADGIELDVHLTADNHLVVTHDPAVDRCSNGSGAIRHMTLAQLRDLDFSAKMPQFHQVRIPLLSDVFDWIAHSSMVVNVEIKAGLPVDDGIEQQCLEVAAAFGMQQRVIYSSFDHYSLQRLQQLDANVKCGLLYSANIVSPWLYAQALNAYAIHPHYYHLYNHQHTQQCHAHHIRVHPWTMDKPEDIQYALRQGVDAIITNKPDIALQLRQAEQKG